MVRGVTRRKGSGRYRLPMSRTGYRTYQIGRPWVVLTKLGVAGMTWGTDRRGRLTHGMPKLKLEKGQSMLLTVEEAAHELAIARSTLYAAMEAGHLPYVRIPTTTDKRKRTARRIRRQDLVEFITRNMTGGWPTKEVRL
jgi:excisionase family DNA binding protein